MPQIEFYLRLGDAERRILRTAALAGDTPTARSVFQLYLPALSAHELSAFIREVRNLRP